MLRDGFRTTNNSVMMPVSAEAEQQQTMMEQPSTTTTLSYMRKAPSQSSVLAQPPYMDHESSASQPPGIMDGRQLFKVVKSRISTDKFQTFLKVIKALNSENISKHEAML